LRDKATLNVYGTAKGGGFEGQIFDALRRSGGSGEKDIRGLPHGRSSAGPDVAGGLADLIFLDVSETRPDKIADIAGLALNREPGGSVAH